jgi:hypothetical protein
MQLRAGMASPGGMSCRRRTGRYRRVSRPGATETRRTNAVSAPGKARELRTGYEARATATAMFLSWRSRSRRQIISCLHASAQLGSPRSPDILAAWLVSSLTCSWWVRPIPALPGRRAWLPRSLRSMVSRWPRWPGRYPPRTCALVKAWSKLRRRLWCGSFRSWVPSRSSGLRPGYRAFRLLHCQRRCEVRSRPRRRQ